MEMIKIPKADNIIPIKSSASWLIIDGLEIGDYYYVSPSVMSYEYFSFAHEVLSKYPLVEIEAEND